MAAGGAPDLDAQVDFIFSHLLVGEVCLDTMITLYCERGGIAPILAGVLGRRAHMPQAVFDELYGLLHNRPASLILRRPLFAKVHVINDDDAAERVLGRLRRWRGRSSVEDDPKQDRGEAEALEVCWTNGFALLSQDHRAVLDARREGIPVGSLIDVLAVMVLRSAFTTANAWLLYLGFLGGRMHEIPGYPAGPGGAAVFEELIERCFARRAAISAPAAPPSAVTTRPPTEP